MSQFLEQDLGELRCRHRLLSRDQLAINDDVAVPVRHRVDMGSGLGQCRHGVILDMTTESTGVFEVLLFSPPFYLGTVPYVFSL